MTERDDAPWGKAAVYMGIVELLVHAALGGWLGLERRWERQAEERWGAVPIMSRWRPGRREDTISAWVKSSVPLTGGGIRFTLDDMQDDDERTTLRVLPDGTMLLGGQP